MPGAEVAAPKAFAFDVFGTIVDWRTSVIVESAQFLGLIGRDDVDPAAFTDAWRGRYLSVMMAYRDSGRPFARLDVLHREMLEGTLNAFGIDVAGLDAGLLGEWNKAWHRLAPWPDTVAGLSRIKTRFPIVTLSNGNVALMLALARYGGLPWDAILGAEFTHAYKPDPQAYLGTAEALGIAPSDLCLVAAHHSDLAAARACGLKTAFVHRAEEYGGAPAPDIKAAQDWDWSAESLIDLAAQLGC